MFDVRVNLHIPFEVKNVEGLSKYDAAENVKKLLLQTLPIVIADNLQKVQDELTFEVVDIEEA